MNHTYDGTFLHLKGQNVKKCELFFLFQLFYYMMGPDKRVNNIIEKNLKVMFEISTPLCAAKLYA